MSEKRISIGECALCKGKFSKASMTKHIQACRRRQPANASRRTRKAFQLFVEGQYSKAYWMHLEVPAHASLFDLDGFLREIWLECCGHLSAFTIQGTTYTGGESQDDMREEESMDVDLAQILDQGTKFFYEYDFGSTTRLALKVVGDLQVNSGSPAIRLLARNDPPAIVCDSCGKPAAQVCSQCNEGWLCDDCATEHECGEEMLLPVVNSPRVGVCGYTGL